MIYDTWKFRIIGAQQTNKKLLLLLLVLWNLGSTIKNPVYRILQTDISGCLDISAHA